MNDSNEKPTNEDQDESTAEEIQSLINDNSDDDLIDVEVVTNRDKVFAKIRELNIDEINNPEELDSLIFTLVEELKVGMIIDGQHRVLGTKNKKIPFVVTALPDAQWPELAFQFIVLNSTAKTVKESLLINIIGTSLKNDELTKVEKRLVDSGIPVPLYQGVMRLHDDPESPFYKMLRFGMNEIAPIDAKAAKSKIASFWHKCSVIYPIVQHLITGRTKKEKLENWITQGLWYEYLKVFWGIAKSNYISNSELWSDKMLPDNSAPVSKLLRSTIINLVQIAICQKMVDSLKTSKDNDPDGKITYEILMPDIEKFRGYCQMYFDRLQPSFFNDWGPASKGLDGSRGPRDEFVKAVSQIITKERSITDLKDQTTGNIIFKLN
jgi:hypothetical protein